MLQIIKSRWWNRWHVYDIDTGGSVWLATFRNGRDAAGWIHQYYADDEASSLSPDFSAADANTNVDVNHPSSNGKPATEK